MTALPRLDDLKAHAYPMAPLDIPMVRGDDFRALVDVVEAAAEVEARPDAASLRRLGDALAALRAQDTLGAS